MKNFFTACFIVFVTLLFITAPSSAQFKMSLGPATGMNFNLHTGSDLGETGTGFGFVFGGQVDMSFSKTVGLLTTLTFYDNRSGSATTTSSNQYQDNRGNPVISTVSNETSASLAYFMIEPLVKFNLKHSDLYFIVGPSFGFNIEGTGESTVTETLPPPYTFDNGQNKIVQKSGKSSMKDLLVRFELKMGAGYNFPIADGIDLAPQVSFGYGITKVMSDVSWRILTIQAICGVKFRLI